MAVWFSPWGKSDVDAEARLLLGSFDAQVQFRGGDDDGALWGVQAWRTYVADAGAAPRFQPHAGARFILPALQYFTEFEARALVAPVVLEVEPSTVNGVDYRRVFISWSTEPSEGHDQYVAWVHPTERRIDRLEYTVREQAAFLTGTMHYRGWTTIDGARFALSQTVTAAPTDDPTTTFLHKIDIAADSVRFDAVDPGSFVVDAALPPSGDHKPPG
jgi:hypothetical protein